MATELPVRIEFSLPDGWNAAPPDEVGAADAAFIALHPPAVNGFTPSITIAGDWRLDDASLDEIADESLRRLGRSVGSTRVRKRVAAGNAEAPTLTQVLDISTNAVNAPPELVQCQVYLAMHDVHEPAKRVVLELVLSCTNDRLDHEVGDFKEFVRTVRPTGGSAYSGPPTEPQLPSPRHTVTPTGNADGGGS